MSCPDAATEYECSCILVKALLQFLYAADRKNVHEWLLKLNDVGEELNDIKIRNDYIAYLLINVQNGRLNKPFNLVPPCGKLRPLSRILPEHVYDDIMKQIKTNICFTNRLDCQEMPFPKGEPLNAEPSNFRNEHPIPLKGITAYCSAFSNYQE